jgi:hypothetical protein
MIKGKQQVLEFFDQVNEANEGEYIHFSIFPKAGNSVEKGNPCITTPKKESWTLSNARDLLTRWLAMQQYGNFIFVLSANETRKTARGSLRQDFSIEENSVGLHAVSGPSMSNEDIQKQIADGIAAALDKKERERELAELKKQVIELTREKKAFEKQAGDPWNKFIGAIQPYIPDLLVEQGLIPKKAVAGVPNSQATPVHESHSDHPANDAEVAEPDAEVQQRLELVVKKFYAARPDDWLELLEMTAEAVVNNPSLADKIKIFL